MIFTQTEKEDNETTNIPIPDESGQEPDQLQEETIPELSGNGARRFVSSTEKYNDYKSSAYSFISVGLLVILLLALSSFKILPLPLTWAEQPILFLTLLFLSLVFLIIGIISFKKAAVYKAQISEENTFESEAVKWFLETYSGTKLDQTIETEEGSLPKEEILCLKRFALICDYLKEKYPTLEDSHAESLCELLYQKLYE